METESRVPKLFIFAGPNGSGKSTLTQILKQSANFPPRYINPDEIALNLSGDEMGRAYEAARIAEEQRQQFLVNQQSFAFETVMSHPSKLLLLEQAQALGYEVNLFFVATKNPLINVGRVQERVIEGGHNVPTNKIVERYYRSLALLPAAIERSSFVAIFDNTDTLALCAELNMSQPLSDTSKLYIDQPWVERALQALEQRETERTKLSEFAQLYRRSLTKAILDQTQYSGIIETQSLHFVTQAINDSTLILHEANFLSGTATLGQKQQINYREGAGKIEATSLNP
jgi:predicted ABC-type ATPase